MKEAVMSKVLGLLAGGAIRVLRGGADVVAHVTSPVDGTRLAIAGLLAGDYVARDELGTEHEFCVEQEGGLEPIPIDGAGATAAITVLAAGGDKLDVIPEAKVSRKRKPAARKRPAAKRPAKPAAKKAAARKKTAAKR